MSSVVELLSGFSVAGSLSVTSELEDEPLLGMLALTLEVDDALGGIGFSKERALQTESANIDCY
jgi:hypothetical protein